MFRASRNEVWSKGRYPLVSVLWCADNMDRYITMNDDKERYHLLCYKCWHSWWSKDGFPKVCPKCGKDPSPPKDEKTLTTLNGHYGYPRPPENGGLF